MKTAKKEKLTVIKIQGETKILLPFSVAEEEVFSAPCNCNLQLFPAVRLVYSVCVVKMGFDNLWGHFYSALCKI